ncbi:MAG: 2-hydroxyacyl-CoA dehydratase family protein [Desulfobacteraceae bacterium]|nr:2-hydroxyacyl-CoA dehydratase family protein [Desulfobacteraceae bacterium]
MKTIAYFDSSHDMPEEILAAAGFIPYKIFGDIHTPNDAADRYLSAFFCPAARSFLTEALTRSEQWEGIVVAQGCNATNRHYDVWKRHVQTPFLYWFNTPLKDDAPAMRFMKAELWRLIDALDKHFRAVVNAESLTMAIHESNRLKKRLQTLAALRSTRDMANREYLEILLLSMRLPKAETIAQVDTLIAAVEKRGPFPANKKKMLLTGSDVTYPEFMDLLDEAGFRVVRDDHSVGERYFATLIAEDGDPVEALARYYLSIPKPATKLSMRGRIDYLLQAVAESKLDTVVSQNLKFCEPYAFDAVLVNAALKEKGCRVLHVEREYTPGPDSQLLNRLAAFAEML